MRAWFAKTVLAVASRKPYPDRITIAGGNELQNDFVVPKLRSKDNKHHFFRFRALKQGLECEVMAGCHDEFKPCCIPNNSIITLVPLFDIYFRGLRFQRSTYLGFLWHIISLSSFRHRIHENTAQAIFNISTPTRKSRYEILRTLAEDRIRAMANKWSPYGGGDNGHKSHVLWASELFGPRVASHKDWDRYLAIVELELEALKFSGDVEKSENGFRASPNALNTLADFELEERRHADNVKWARRLTWLTGTLIFVGVGQVLASLWNFS